MKTAHRLLAPLVGLTLMLGCSPESDQVTFGFSAMSFANSEWSAPVNVGAPINTSAAETQPALSSDDLSLYFTSTRTDGVGGTDMWVSHRACVDCSWEAPVNLAPLNTASNDAGASISIDGHLLFFFSNRDPAGGTGDIYVSRRANPTDDLGWGPPVKLGPEVNTPAFEAGPEYMQTAEAGAVNLYFGRQPVGGVFDMYGVAVTRDGEVRGPAVLVAELSPGTGATVRKDGREVLFLSTRPEGLGLQDLYVSTRQGVHQPWSAPVNVTVLNSTVMDRHPSLSSNARTLFLASNRPGGLGGDDLWMATRTVSGN